MGKLAYYNVTLFYNSEFQYFIDQRMYVLLIRVFMRIS